MKDLFDFNASMLNNLIVNTLDEKVQFSDITNWHSSHPYYRLNFYNNIQISQVLGIYLAFNKDWLNQFDNIIEIGTYNGGLSSYIYDTKKKDCFFVSYDIDPSINLAKKQRQDIDFRIGDCFDTDISKEIIEYINRDGKTLLICDGGNKTKEFNIFSDYIKENDVIILHDFLYDAETWKTNTDYWQWPYGNETSYAEIVDSIKRNNLKDFDNRKFNFYLWGAYIKN